MYIKYIFAYKENLKRAVNELELFSIQTGYYFPFFDPGTFPNQNIEVIFVCLSLPVHVKIALSPFNDYHFTTVWERR